MRRTIYDEQHETFRKGFRAFLEKEAVPYVADWEAAGVVDRRFFKAAGDAGFLGFEAPEEHGGLDVRDFRYNSIMAEEVVDSGMSGDTFSIHNDIVTPYLLELTNEAQRCRWLPDFTSGNMVTALAMTEPDAGSDLAAIRTSGRQVGSDIVLNGTKTFITNGSSCDLVIVLVRTGEDGGRGTSLVVVEHGTPGFTRGRPMSKIGRRSQDTAELIFADCRVPRSNIIGQAGRGFSETMRNLPRERLSIATLAVASAEKAFQWGLRYARERRAFGGPLTALQSVRMALAEMRTEISIARTYVDQCVLALNDGDLDHSEAAGVKYWSTDLQWNVLDRCLQLFGGNGYMEEYPIARAWRDARVQRIYGGTNEIMKEVVGRAVVNS
jgi:acyl-CoA dehydrogenase